MIRNLKFFILVLTFIFIIFHSKNLSSFENKILIKINNEVITTIDIYNEVNYLKILNPDTKKLDEQKLFKIAKNSLIKEKTKQITLLKIVDEIYIDENYLNNIIKSIYNRFNIKSLEEFQNYLKKNNTNLEYIKNKITIDRLWNEMIFQKFNSSVKIDRNKIKNDILNNPNEKLLLSEILFPKSEPKLLKSKIKKIKNDIQNEGFSNAALIHSISDSANKGGNIGWINRNSLNNILKNELSKINVGEYTEPILTPSGYLIIKLNEIKQDEISNDDINKRVDRMINIKTNQQLNQLSNIYLNKLEKDLIINEL
tara:strand:+ start:183 stop:1118 length:936 start_codon:yes stop_codon:yes gene_type:complete